MEIGSLFTGLGGIELAFEKHGFKTVWASESDPYAQAVIRKRFPETIIYGDVTKINFRTVPKVQVPQIAEIFAEAIKDEWLRG